MLPYKPIIGYTQRYLDSIILFAFAYRLVIRRDFSHTRTGLYMHGYYISYRLQPVNMPYLGPLQALKNCCLL